MNPSMVGSMMIVVPGVERVVIVFPAMLDGAEVPVGDVLRVVAVHRPVREWASERHDDSGWGKASKGETTFQFVVKLE